MTERPRIVVGIDASDCAERALDFALLEAAVHDADLDVVHAWQSASPRVLHRVDARVAADAQRLVDETVKSRLTFVKRAPDRIARIAARGTPTSVLELRAAGAQQLVIGTHGRGFTARMLVGSVSHHCVLHVPTAVTVVPIRHDGLDFDEHVVVAVDGSEPSYAALRWATDEAAVRRVPLRVVHAWYVPFADDMKSAERESLSAVVREDGEELLRNMTEGVVGRAAGLPPQVITSLVEGRPSLAVLTAAEGASLLVLGTSGRGGTAALVGSVSRHALLHTRRPTTFVKEHQR